MHKCKSCGEKFDFPDYVPFTRNRYQRQKPNAWSSGLMMTVPYPLTAACPFCQRGLNHGNLDKYLGKDQQLYDDINEAEETFQGIQGLEDLET